MNKVHIFLIFLIVALMIAVLGCGGGSSGSSKETDAASEISLPPIVNLFQYNENADYRFPSHEEYRIWGWSKDGKVAYSYIMNDGGLTMKHVIIFNLVDNSFIYNNQVSDWLTDEAYNHDNDGNAIDDDGQIIDFNAIYKEFHNICIENGIEFVQTEYKRLPVVHNNKTFNIIEDVLRKDVDGLDVVDRYQIVVETEGEIKIIQTAQEGYTYNIFSLGYFISPFENRALLVMGSHIVGGYLYNFFVGFDLDSGFAAMDRAEWSLSENIPEDYGFIFVTESDWEGVTCEIIHPIDESSGVIQECFFPNATLRQAYNVVNKPFMEYLQDDLPEANAEFSHLDGLLNVTYEYKSEKHLYIRYIWDEAGAGFSLEIIEEENGTKSKYTEILP